jgi:type IV secretory pathway VirB10-like protein
MNKLSRTLLLVGALVLALLIGLLIGRGQRVNETSDGNAQAVQITTAPPPSLPEPTPLPPMPPQPQRAAIPKIAPEVQVQEDAAAVGMTTRDGDEQAAGDTAPAPAPKTAATPDDSQAQQPIG